MARRRMFALDVVDTDAFLDLPVSSQSLYFHLGMRADDDGFVGSPKRVTQMVSCNPDDLRLLIQSGFVIPFESGVCVIRDWRANNQLRTDRYKSTRYVKELAMLSEDEAGRYTLLGTSDVQSLPGMATTWQPHGNHTATTWQPNGNQMETQYSIGKDRLGKDSIGESAGVIGGAAKPSHSPQNGQKRFIPPSVDEVQAYIAERESNIDAQRFVDFYAAKGWKVGNQDMKDWKAALRTWERRDNTGKAPAVKNTVDVDLSDIFGGT